MYIFKKYDIEKLKSIDYNTYSSVDIYFTYDWLYYLKESMNVTPIIIEIYDDKKIIGYFVCCSFKKFGVKILGSPFRGWDTPYMGFMLNTDVKRTQLILELWNFLKKEFKCSYMEICDRNITKEEIPKNIKYIVESTYYMDIGSRTEEELLGSFTKHCRKDLRLFVNRGATVKKVEYNSLFLDKFYEMLINVFSVQGLTPPYSKEKLSILFSSINKENMLCIETYNPDGKCIGMSVSFGYGDYCYAFASATDRSENYNQKNYLRWFAIKYWKENGKKYYDLMGKRNYKLEFNPEIKEYYRIILTKWKILLPLRNIAQKMYWVLNKVKYKFKSNNK